jgi:hypothetical protein
MSIDGELGKKDKNLTLQQEPGAGGGSSNLHPEVLEQAQQNATPPETTQPIKGIDAAVGTDYTWNQQGQQKAVTQYKSDIITQQQNFLTNRQTIENNAVNYQAQADMMKYQANQNAEKVGWTGGSVLDQNRQMEYLKEGIQAQMYGAMDLQKEGYKSALAAARFSYDLNQQEFAHQYYVDAQTEALNEAQITGVYFSAETKDMMNQLSIADRRKDDQSLSEEERTRARNLSNTIEKWFSDNGISKAGVKTLEAWTAEQSAQLEWANQLYAQYNAALQTARADIADNATAFIRYIFDENGNPIIDYTGGVGGEVQTIDMDHISADKLINYIKQTYTNAAGKEVTVINDKAKEQAQAYVNFLYNQALTQAQTVTTDSNGNKTTTTNKNKTEYKEALDALEKFVNAINEAIGEGTITNPIKDTDKPQNPVSGSSNSGSSGGLNNEYNSIGSWNSDTTITVTGDNGEKALTLSNLQYLDWNDPDGRLTNGKNYPKSSVSINVSELPDSWAKVLKNQLGIKDDFLLEVLPTEIYDSENHKISGIKVEGRDAPIIALSEYNGTKDFGLGGQIEYFLKDFYENTTGQPIKAGSMIVLGDYILVWNGDNGDQFNTHNAVQRHDRWLLWAKTSSDSTNKKLYEYIVAL